MTECYHIVWFGPCRHPSCCGKSYCCCLYLAKAFGRVCPSKHLSEVIL